MGEIADLLRADSLALRRAGSKALQQVANAQLASIQKRLDRGISSTGARFIDYAPSTARRKGRTRPVTLFERGNMRSAMYVRRIRLDRYEITFRDRQSEKVARWQHAGTKRSTRRDQVARRRARGTRRIVRNTGPFRIPPRPFIEATREEIADADRTMDLVIGNEFPSDLRRRIKIVVTI